MEGKENRRITITKRMLKDALVELLEERDIYHISVRELCERADINRTTFTNTMAVSLTCLLIWKATLSHS